MPDRLLTVPVPVLSVSELNQRLRGTLERNFGEVWVGGEISNFRVPASGHFYFSLKDQRSQIAAVMFRSANQRLPFRPQDGLEVIVRGRVSLYEVRGDLQLYVDAMEPRGLGGLQLALEQLKQRLQAEGLFDAARKRPLPFWPRAVGVVTALTGAAVHDIVTTLRGRLPQVRIIVRPVRVQGAEAVKEIVEAIADLNGVPEVEVLIVGRGGGSLEDLWAFNEEAVARAISGSSIPVVSAVGHEIDVTVADLVADCRAATPTAAAALVVPDGRELAHQVSRSFGDLAAALRGRLQAARQRLTAVTGRLRDPQQQLRAQRVRIDELGERARRAIDSTLRLLRQRQQARSERLQALSPLAVLQRGYSITQRGADGRVVRAAREVAPDDPLKIVFAEGAARVRVESVDE